MLLALCSAFALSQSFRTVAAILAPPLQAQFHLSAQQLGLFAGAFHFAFGALQFFMGMGIDVHGLRRTVLVAFPLAIAGAVLSAMAQSFPVLVMGQVLIGIGCAPAFLVCTVFIARHFPPEQFASVSGLTMGLGSVGMLLTGTPLAWLVDTTSWRAGFVALALCSLAAWLLMAWKVREPAITLAPAPSMWAALKSYGALFALPHTLGILALASVTYAAFISLRGLWLGPLLVERHGFSLVESGNIALVVSIVGLVGPPLFGRYDPGPASRRRWIVAFTLCVAAGFLLMALAPTATIDVAVMLVVGVLSGYIVLQYADTKAAYPAEMAGRALALFTMAMFLGVAVMQWLTGAVASLAKAHGLDPFVAVLLTIAGLLGAGAAAFAWLPRPPRAADGASTFRSRA
ncbi:MFS transporter [Variovorax dokdonensis]|uniref:MFS transporter n=1 Tax=Variovorax dokdonensis TaxID=344883 RepID=A0ABT7N9H8_9BURK|nr:MFS transporter [Variovorax dokdonensis]MDM0044593.1 MFS transporter [Variovorax dokdonensis]